MRTIKNFYDFINEGALYERSNQGSSGNVLFIQAGSSKTSLKPELQKKLGINGSTRYSITLDRLDKLYVIWSSTFASNKKWNSLLSGNKIPGVDFKSLGQSKVEERDYFKINGNDPIVSIGEISINPSNLGPGPINIEASGNGILTLTRLCHAIFDMVKDSMGKIDPSFLQNNKNWEIKIILGGDAKTGKNRGYRYYYYLPGVLDAYRNLISDLICVSSLRYDNPSLSAKIDLKNFRFPSIDNRDAWWIDEICTATSNSRTIPSLNSSIPLVINSILNKIRLSLIKRKFILSNEPVDISEDWEYYIKGISRYLRKTSERVSSKAEIPILAFNEIGAKEATNLQNSIAEKMAISGDSLNDVNLPNKFVSIIKTQTSKDLSRPNGFSFDDQMLKSQRIIKFDPSIPNSTQINDTKEVQLEGEF